MAKRRRIRIDRLLILVGALVLCIMLVFGVISGIFNLLNPKLIADEYRKPNTEIKLSTDKIDSDVYSKKNKETDSKMIYAIHVPKLENEEVNQQIKDFVNKMIEEKAMVTHIDYESNQAFGQYKSYVITANLYENIDELIPSNIIKTEQLFINFDGESLIDLDDCVRGKVISQIANDKKVEKDKVVLSKITDKGIQIDVEGSKINYPYDDSSFVMKNDKIKTLLKYEKINVEKRQLDPNKPMIALTFDDGPNPANAEKILAALNKVGGRATFFQLGSLMEKYPETVRKIVESGSEVASHSYGHDELTKKPLEEALADIQYVNDIFFSLTGNEIQLLRPPYGSYSSELEKAIPEKIVTWTVDTMDWSSRNPQKIVEETKKSARDGSIVLLHEIYSTTVTAAEELIQYYHEQGYQLVTVSELLEMKENKD